VALLYIFVVCASTLTHETDVDDDSLSLMTRCCRVALVYELL